MRRQLRIATALAAGLVTTVAMTVIATAQEDSTTGTVNVGGAPIRSISVSPGSFNFDSCGGGSTISFPNDTCAGGQLLVTNGDEPSTVFVRATDFAGSAGGVPWTLCPAGDCIAEPVGVDQALLAVDDGVAGGWQVATDDQCHGYWDPTVGEFGDCAASPNQQVELAPFMFGPEATTNASPSFATVITWSALP